ncbi:MAG: amidohydrolase family protein [Acidobacteriota bacterium]
MLRCYIRSALFICIVLSTALVTVSQAQTDEPPYFAIRNARIVPVSGPVIDNGTVVIARGLITAVGKDVTIPPEAWVIDGKGLTVYPGFIDAFTDLGLPTAAPSTVTPGQGGANNPQQATRVARGPEDRPATTPWQHAADELNPEDKRFESWRNACFTSALVAKRDGIFSGQGALINLAGERAGDMIVKSPATLNISFQSPGGFISFPGSLMGTMAYVKQVLLDTTHFGEADKLYRTNPRGLQRPEYDRAVRAIYDALISQRPVLLPGNTSAQILRTLKLSEEFSLRTVLYGGQQGYEVASTLAAKRIPVLVSLKWPEKDREADPDADESLELLRLRDRAPSTPAALEKAGVKFAFYSDGITNPKDILKNAKKAIEAGLPPEAALRAFTLNAAEIFGVVDQLGSIDTGKIANLVVADGDLFNDKTKVKMIFVDGHKYEVREPSRPTEPPTVNLTGRWTLTVASPQGTQTVTADLTMSQDGTLTGTVTSAVGSGSISTGYVSSNKFSFTVTLTLGQRPVDTTFSGNVENNQMKGSVSLGRFSAEFTGIRPNTEMGGEQ